MRLHRNYCDICKKRLSGSDPTGTIATTLSGIAASEGATILEACFACVRAVNDVMEERLKPAPSSDKEWRP